MRSGPFERARVAAESAAREASRVVSGLAAAEVTGVDVEFGWEGERLGLKVSVEGFSRGRLDERAVLAVNAAATALAADLGAAAGRWAMSETRVTQGGVREYGPFDPAIEVAVLSVSDAVAEGAKDDRAGRAVRDALRELEERGVVLGRTEVLPDDAERIRESIEKAAEGGCDVVLTVGGTGITHTDVTVETVEAMLDREVPGIMEAARSFGQQRTALAMLSRGVAGLLENDTLVATFPGSTGGARETCAALLPAMFRAVVTVRKSRALL